MDLNRLDHIKLIDSEITYQTNEFEKLLRKYAAKMFIDQELYLCEFQGFDESRGNVLVKFDHKTCRPPRKNEMLQCFLSEFQNKQVKAWGGITYEQLRSKVKTQFESKTIFFKYEKDHTIVGLSGAQTKNLSKFQKGDVVFLAPTDPPLNYLVNLKNYLEDKESVQDAFLNIEISTPIWEPIPLKVDEHIVETFLNEFQKTDTIIIQGPPGTGKTYLMAQLCASFLESGKKVMVTALTNRALIELAEKEFLKNALERGLVYKTSLSVQESRNKKTKGLKGLTSMSKQDPPLLLSTYYVMSQLATKVLDNDHFDYIIIEEASQAFLSTIALAKKLGKKVIIIGDIKQLEPIFHKEFKDENPKGYRWMVSGLRCLSMFYRDACQYILTDTYRLTNNSVQATNAFYKGLLKSNSQLETPLNFKKHLLLNECFDNMGGVTFLDDLMPPGKGIPEKDKRLLVKLIQEILEWDPKAHVSILSFYRNTVRSLQKDIFPTIKQDDQIIIETVDRIQGLTTDFTIYYIPKESTPFALDLNRFNVATSRARKGTLIIADSSLKHFVKLKPELGKFFENVSSVHIDEL